MRSRGPALGRAHADLGHAGEGGVRGVGGVAPREVGRDERHRGARIHHEMVGPELVPLGLDDEDVAEEAAGKRHRARADVGQAGLGGGAVEPEAAGGEEARKRCQGEGKALHHRTGFGSLLLRASAAAESAAAPTKTHCEPEDEEHRPREHGRDRAGERAERAEDPEDAALLVLAAVERDEARRRGVDEARAHRDEGEPGVHHPWVGAESRRRAGRRPSTRGRPRARGPRRPS